MKELNSLRNRPVKHRQWPCVYQYFMLLRMSISSAMFMWHPGTSSALATNSALLYACRLKLGGLVLCYNKTLHRTNMGKRSLTRKIPRFIFHNAKTYGKNNLITYYATYGCPCKPSIVEGLETWSGQTDQQRDSFSFRILLRRDSQDQNLKATHNQACTNRFASYVDETLFEIQKSWF